MTLKDYTALVLIVDSSGSMARIANDMEGAIDTLLDQQRKLPGKLTVDTVYFDAPRGGFISRTIWPGSASAFEPAVHEWYKEVDHFADPKDVVPTIVPGGGTALLDAIGRKINSFGEALAGLAEDERPETVLVAIVTDGEENSSHEFTYEQIQEMVKHQTDVYNWDFMYLGANQDAIAVAGRFGVKGGSALTWNTDNVAMASATMDSYVTNTRSFGAGSYEFTAEEREANK
jgi:hypothetical protein